MPESLESIRAKYQPIIPPSTVAAPIIIHEERQLSEPDGNQAREEDEEQSDLIKTFTLRIAQSQSHYKHITNIRLNALHGPWPKSHDDDEDFVSAALKEVIPKDLAAPGLCNWYTGGQILEDTKHMRSSGEFSKNWHIRQRQERNRSRRQSSSGEDTLVAWSSVDGKIRTSRSTQTQNRPIGSIG